MHLCAAAHQSVNKLYNPIPRGNKCKRAVSRRQKLIGNWRLPPMLINELGRLASIMHQALLTLSISVSAAL